MYEKEVTDNAPLQPSFQPSSDIGIVSAPNIPPAEEAPRKKQKFSLSSCIRTDVAPRPDANEVNRYKAASLEQLGLNIDSQIDDPFFVVKFWYNKKRTYPRLYKVAMRIYATPASSSTSERVFSTLNNIVTSQRSQLSAKHLSELIVARSLHLYNN